MNCNCGIHALIREAKHICIGANGVIPLFYISSFAALQLRRKQADSPYHKAFREGFWPLTCIVFFQKETIRLFLLETDSSGINAANKVNA